MIKVFLSVPMRGRKKENVEYTVNRIKAITSQILFDQDEIEFVYTKMLNDDLGSNITDKERIVYLSDSIKRMADCDYIVVLDGLYYEFRGCNVEHMIANNYGINVIHLNSEWVIKEDELQEIHRKINNCECEGTCSR